MKISYPDYTVPRVFRFTYSSTAKNYKETIQKEFPHLQIELNSPDVFTITFSSEEEYQLVTEFMNRNPPQPR